MARNPRRPKMRYRRKGDLDQAAQRLGKIAQARSEHDPDVGQEGSFRANGGDCLVDARIRGGLHCRTLRPAGLGSNPWRAASASALAWSGSLRWRTGGEMSW